SWGLRSSAVMMALARPRRAGAAGARDAAGTGDGGVAGGDGAPPGGPASGAGDAPVGLGAPPGNSVTQAGARKSIGRAQRPKKCFIEAAHYSARAVPRGNGPPGVPVARG